MTCRLVTIDAATGIVRQCGVTRRDLIAREGGGDGSKPMLCATPSKYRVDEPVEHQGKQEQRRNRCYERRPQHFAG